MKKLIIWAACGLSFLLPAMAQTTTTYTGTIKDLTQTVVTAGQVTFELRPGIDTTISGTARFTPSTVVCTINGSGLVKALDGTSACVTTNNTSLSPAGTSYRICIQPYSVTPGSCFNDYALGGSKDITTIVPTPGTMPAFTFVDLNSTQSITGVKTWTAAGNLFSAGVSLGTYSGTNNFTMYGNTTPTFPTQGSLASGDDRVFQYCTPKNTVTAGCGFYIYRWNAGFGVPQNELQIESHFDPALAIDNLNTGVGHRTQIVFRRSGLQPLTPGAWMINADNAGDDTNAFALTQIPNDATDAESRMTFFQVKPKLNSMGVGTSVQSALEGNLQNQGFIQSFAKYNDTTGRAAFQFLASDTTTQIWMRQNGTKIETALARNGGTPFVIFGSNGLDLSNVGTALATATVAIGAGACAAVQTQVFAGAASTDVVLASPNVDLPTQWQKGLTTTWFSTSGNINVRVCNPTAGSITPDALTWNVRIIH